MTTAASGKNFIQMTFPLQSMHNKYMPVIIITLYPQLKEVEECVFVLVHEKFIDIM